MKTFVRPLGAICILLVVLTSACFIASCSAVQLPAERIGYYKAQILELRTEAEATAADARHWAADVIAYAKEATSAPSIDDIVEYANRWTAIETRATAIYDRAKALYKEAEKELSGASATLENIRAIITLVAGLAR